LGSGTSSELVMAVRAASALSLLARRMGNVDPPPELRLLPLDDGTFDLAPGSPLSERSARVEWTLPSYTKSAELHVLPGLLQPSLAAELVAALPEDVNTDPDSVDSLPTFELPLQSFQQPLLLDTDSEAGAKRARLRELTQPVLDEKILPYVRVRYDCPSCRVCTSLLRRYLPDERRRHPSHFDTQAFVTVVVSLSAFGTEFSGGLYVRRGGSGAGGRGAGDAYLPLSIGDAVAHQFDVEHGVEVGDGARHSWIVWLQDGECVPGGKAAWHEAAAAEGDPVSMYNLGNVISMSDPMDGEKLAEAHKWFVRAAEGGYAAAMFSAGVMHVKGPPTVEQDEEKGLAWLERAAEAGELHAMYNTGFLLVQRPGRVESGLRWFETAAEAGDAKSAYALAAMYLGQGEPMGIEKDAATAQRWMGVASELGHPEACYRLATTRLQAASREGKKRGQKGRKAKGMTFSTSDDNFATGLELLKRAATRGHDGARALLKNLLKQDASKAERWPFETLILHLTGSVAAAAAVGWYLWRRWE